MPRKKGTTKKNYTETYYTLSEEEMQELIRRAQLKDQAAQLELLKTFSNFLAKYTTLLYDAKYNLSDYDIRRFLGLFVKDKYVRSYLLRNKLTSAGHKTVQEALRGVNYMVKRFGDREDVDQTVKMAFLACVSTYRQRGAIPFSGFLYSYFFYVLKKYVDTFLIDQLGRKTFPLIDNESFDMDNSDEDITPGFTAPPSPAADKLLGCEEIDEDWVLGLTCNYPFNQLTMQERQLLKWKYADNARSSEIAVKITEHANTSREHIGRIRSKLRTMVADDLEDAVGLLGST